MCLAWLIYVILFFVTYRIYKYVRPIGIVYPVGKYVLISGCDSGFGRHLAIELDRKGFNVFATVYNSENEPVLSNILGKNSLVFKLDITKVEDIENAYKIITSKTDYLYALVNNAGIDQDGLIDWISMEFMRNMMEINFFGHVAITKRFLPLLIEKKDSRIINLCSVAGFLAAPAMSAYCASKYALESFSDCLRREMSPWSLHVSIVEPGYMKTPIIEGHVQTMQKIWDQLSPETKSRWGEAYLKNLMDKRTNNHFIKLAEDPMKVVRDLEDAVISRTPKIRYRPGWQSPFLFFPLSMIPAWITDFLLANVRGSNVIPAGVKQQIEK